MDRNLEGLTLNRDTWCSFEDENLFVKITKPLKADQEKKRNLLENLSRKEEEPIRRACNAFSAPTWLSCDCVY